jgi:hypothetical protein
MLGALGPFFAVDHHASDAMPGGSWQPLTQLLRPVGVRARVEQVRIALAATRQREVNDVPWRIAASIAHQGLAARLISPQLGVLMTGVGSGLDPEETWWQPVLGGPVPLSVGPAALVPGSADAGLVIEGVVRTLTELFAAESVSPRVLWGNVASAVNAACNAIASVRPELAETARLQAVAALEHRLLAGMSNGRPGRNFRRTNCCLIYRLDPPAPSREGRQVCGDCVLSDPATAPR